MIGFLEEAAGVRSMTRLTVALMIAAVFVLVGAIPVVALRVPEHAAGIIAAMASALGTLAGGIWGALSVRNKGVDAA